MSSSPATLETPLARELAAHITERGPITFAEYMEACLYHPAHGYYSRPERSRFADYYTSVDVHPIFGRLIARQLEQMWRVLDRPARFDIVESGAGAGRLAAQSLDFAAARLPDFYNGLHYFAVERSAARRSAHVAALATHLAGGHAESSAEIPARIPAGCLFSNEMFDAMPVHRVVQQSVELREIYVCVVRGKLGETTGAISTPRIAEYYCRQEISLREGQQAEAGLAACDWIGDAARRLERGFVLTVDYGYPARELYNAPRRMRGTLLAYRDHRVSEDYYSAPGEQDLTAHANFTALEMWGKDGGLEVEGLVSQSRFLPALGRENEFADLYDLGQSEKDRLMAQMQLSTLIHPEGMGDTFQALIQRKGIGSSPLAGLAPL